MISEETVGSALGKVDDSTTGKHIPALDGVRGCAILLVFAVHFFWSAPYVGRNPILWTVSTVRAQGWMGVNLFFVLSGFLITGILYDTQKSQHFFRNFYARRALRIFPLYYGSLALITLLLLIFHGHWNGVELLKLLTYTRNLFFGPPAPATSLSLIEVRHFWSLAVEEQFYLVWPLVIFLLKTRRRIAIACIAGILLSIATRILLMHTNVPQTTPYVLMSWTPANLDGLCAGALLAIGVRTPWKARLLAFALPVLLFAAIAVTTIATINPEFRAYQDPHGIAYLIAPLVNLGSTALIGCSLRLGSGINQVLSYSFFRFFGRYSYGLYVFHYTIATWMIAERPRVELLLHSRILTLLCTTTFGLLASIGLALLSFKFYEQPILRLKRYFPGGAQPSSFSVKTTTA